MASLYGHDIYLPYLGDTIRTLVDKRFGGGCICRVSGGALRWVCSLQPRLFVAFTSIRWFA